MNETTISLCRNDETSYKSISFIMSGIYDTHARIHKCANFLDSKQCSLLGKTNGYLSVLRDFQ